MGTRFSDTRVNERSQKVMSTLGGDVMGECVSLARAFSIPSNLCHVSKSGGPASPPLWCDIRFGCWRAFRIAKRKKQACPYLESVNTKLENTRDDETGTLCNDSIASFLNCFQTHLRQVSGNKRGLY